MPAVVGDALVSPLQQQQLQQQEQQQLQQDLQRAQQALQIVRSRQENKRVDREKCAALMQRVKGFVALTTLETLSDPTLLKEVALVGRDCFETAAFLAIEEMQQAQLRRTNSIEDDDSIEGDEFERYMMMLMPYYTDYASVLPPSQHRNELLCLHLLHYLASNRIGEFHMALQALAPDVRADSMIQKVLQLEQHLLEGSYGELLHHSAQQQQQGVTGSISSSSSSSTSSSIGSSSSSRSGGGAAVGELPVRARVFLERLVRTVRVKVAASLERAHTQVDVEYALRALCLRSVEELLDFMAARNVIQQREDFLTHLLPLPLAAAAPAAAASASFSRDPVVAANRSLVVAGGLQQQQQQHQHEAEECTRNVSTLSAGVSSGSFASAIRGAAAAALPPDVEWILDSTRHTLFFRRLTDGSAHAPQCSFHAMQVIDILISKQERKDANRKHIQLFARRRSPYSKRCSGQASHKK